MHCQCVPLTPPLNESLTLCSPCFSICHLFASRTLFLTGFACFSLLESLSMLFLVNYFSILYISNLHVLSCFLIQIPTWISSKVHAYSSQVNLSTVHTCLLPPVSTIACLKFSIVLPQGGYLSSRLKLKDFEVPLEDCLFSLYLVSNWVIPFLFQKYTPNFIPLFSLIPCFLITATTSPDSRLSHSQSLPRAVNFP